MCLPDRLLGSRVTEQNNMSQRRGENCSPERTVDTEMIAQLQLRLTSCFNELNDTLTSSRQGMAVD